MPSSLQTKIFIYFLPVYYIYNMLIDVVFSRGGALGLLLNIGVLLYFLHITLQNRYNYNFKYIYMLIIFNIILIFCNSSELLISVSWFAKIIIGILCFPLSFYLISGNDAIVHFIKMLLILMGLYLINLVLANVLGWGNAYGGDSEFAVQGGASIVTGSMPIVMVLMAMPLIFYVYPDKERILFFWAFVLISMFLIFKRTNLAAILVGYIIFTMLYVYLKRKFNLNRTKFELSKKKMLSYGMFAMITLSICMITFGDIIVKQYEIRARKFEKTSLQKEGRVVEWELVKKEILESKSLTTTLFGKEPYNTVGNYGYSSSRNIHGDYSLILFSTGVMGSIFYWGIQIYIAFLILCYRRDIFLRNTQDILMMSVYLSTSIIWFLFSYSAASYYVVLSSVYYMLHGAILRYFWNKEQRYKIVTV